MESIALNATATYYSGTGLYVTCLVWRRDVKPQKCYEFQRTVLNNISEKDGLSGQTTSSGLLEESLGNGECKFPTSG